MPREGADELPVAASHSLRVWSSLPESTRAPLGEKATEWTPPACPVKVRMSWPPAASHSLRLRSSLPESTRVPSGENAPGPPIEHGAHAP